jgi:hypothetical protein
VTCHPCADHIDTCDHCELCDGLGICCANVPGPALSVIPKTELQVLREAVQADQSRQRDLVQMIRLEHHQPNPVAADQPTPSSQSDVPTERSTQTSLAITSGVSPLDPLRQLHEPTSQPQEVENDRT